MSQTVCLVAGVVDEDYRGNVGVVLFNFSKETFEGMSLSSLVLKLTNGSLHVMFQRMTVDFLVFCSSVKKGDRIAQLICERICYPDLEELEVCLTMIVHKACLP